MPASFLWYDLETWGTDPRSTRIAQFAAIRTDQDLQVIDDPATVWVAPALDLLPSPEAALVTGLDPLTLQARGCHEADAFSRIHALLAEPGTCTAGWNTLRFDDEFIRHGLYRNFYDPYEREWANGNARWDLLDCARLLYALRPDGLQWPLREDGAPSFRLEHLAAANGVAHGQAHDALSDVEATLGLARRFRAAQPRMWDYYLDFRDKQRALRLLDPARGEPLLHVSSKFPAERGCAGIVLPLARHPSAGNQIIVLELHDDPAEWSALDSAQIAARVFTRSDQLPEGSRRIALKTVHANRCPALVALHHVSDSELQRLGLERARCLRHAAQVLATPELVTRVVQAFRREFADHGDVDGALYDALPDRRDAALRQRIRRAPPERLGEFAGDFHDPRGAELLFRYRARNWPDSLNHDERHRWQQHLQRRLQDPTHADSLAAYRGNLARLRASYVGQTDQLSLLDRLDHWAERVAAAAGLPTAA